MKNELIGFVDILGTFILPLRDHHVDPYKQDKLGFFKKISFHEKLKEYNDSLLQNLNMLRDVVDVEY